MTKVESFDIGTFNYPQKFDHGIFCDRATQYSTKGMS